MKRNATFLFLLLLIATTIKAQTNLQVHYDFGEGRKYITTTLEMFKPDKWGNTFFFVDTDFGKNASGKKESPTASYMEIARCLNFWGGPLSAQVEYNGGLGLGYGINNAYLVGLDYSIHNANFSKTLNLKALYKNIQGINNTPQFTAVWCLHLMDKKVTLSGFADLWWEKNTYFNAGAVANPVFITEPQIWYNFTENISTGSEVEIASNFGGTKGFKVCPTLAVKWNF